MTLTTEEQRVIEILRKYNAPYAEFLIERKEGKVYMITPTEKLKVDFLSK